ncbi:lipocalin-like domain-containing protein [Flavobacterium pallidum]|uniref:Lipocalin-like domain-containing protein n=1 Tax=Flavobacterium pallidum TaxID=2172098 RepID=A0A2S1SJX1_9FLAO|nr:lipocalin family protein [Flavobacterium pallidum]AWI26724.1 hypothetical protein HYN49_12915 [Flavobacterium pallidum]
MKNVLKIAVLVLSMAFVGCSSDDDEASIVGKWNFSKEGLAAQGQEVLSDYTHATGCTKDNVEFKADGTITDTFYDDACAATVTNGTYTKSGNTVVVTMDGEATTYEVKQLSGSSLKVYNTETFEGQTFTNVTVFTKN